TKHQNRGDGATGISPSFSETKKRTPRWGGGLTQLGPHPRFSGASPARTMAQLRLFTARSQGRSFGTWVTGGKLAGQVNSQREMRPVRSLPTLTANARRERYPPRSLCKIFSSICSRTCITPRSRFLGV